MEATAAIIAPIVESVRPLHPPKIWEDISPQFLVTFWSLSMYDLRVPVDSYQKEIAKIKQLSLTVLDSKENVSANKITANAYCATFNRISQIIECIEKS